MTLSKQEKIFYYSWTVLTLLLIVLAITFDGTGGNGDSVYHYLYSKYSWQNNSLFFNHWAKPFFTIVTSPFAQFGFVGIKLFNVLASSISVLFTYRIAKHFNLKFAYLVFIPLFFAPLFFRTSMSGLTEPLSALMLTAFILLWLKEKNTSAIILVSFLPFVRSEGLIMMGVIFAFLLWTKQWKYIPLLLIGHIVIALIGLLYYSSILWVFNETPYAHLSSVYGVGNWMHFVNQLYFCLGPFTYIFLIVGLVKELFQLFSKKEKPTFYNEKLFLVYGIFMAFFVAHSAFWALGIFNSMGLNRVFVTVFPLIALISLDGLNTLSDVLPNKIKNVVPLSILGLTIVFSLIGNPASIDFKNDLNLDASQKLVKEKVVPYLLDKYPNHMYMSGDIAVTFFANKNIFDPKEGMLLYDYKPQELLDSNFVFIWDPWFAKVEGRLELEEINASSNLKRDTSFVIVGKNGESLEYIIYSSVR